MHHLPKNLCRSALFLSVSLTPFAAMAHQAAEPSGLAEIVVTASKREQSIQDVGVALAAFDSDALRDRGVDNIAALADAMPGVKLLESTGGGVPVIIIRGVGLQDFRINNTPTAAIYVDEVYQTSVAQAGFTFYDLDRLEVLKGPQGGLYGRNTTGGAIQVISKRPSLEEWDGYVDSGYARYGTFSAEGAVGGPLVSDRVGVRISGKLVKGRSGPSHSVLTGEGHGAEDRWGLRGLLAIEPTDTLDFLFKIHGGQDQSETMLLRTLPIWSPGTTASPGLGAGPASASPRPRSAICPDLLAGNRPNFNTCATLTGVSPSAYGLTDEDKQASISNPINRLDNSWWGTSLQANLDLGAVKVTSISAFDHFKVGRLTDWDAVPLVIQHIDYRSSIKAYSQELRLAYNSSDIDLLAGATYATDTLVENSRLFADAGLVPVAFGTNLILQPYRQKTDMWAVFGRLDWRMMSNLTLVAEARYTEEKKHFAGGTFLVTPNRFLVNVDRRASFGDYSGKLALEYRPDRDLLAYASVSRGFKSGGFFGGIATSAAQTEAYRPETVIAYEAGIKSEWFDRRLRANGAVFFYDYKDLQGFGRESVGAVQIQRLTNVGDVQSFGIEADLTAVPADGITLSANATYLDGEIKKSSLTVADSFNFSTTNPLVGQGLLNAPKWSFAMLGRVERPVGPGLKAAFQADVSYRSSQNFGYINVPEERPLFYEGGFTLVGARASLGEADGKWELSAWVKNLFDVDFRTTARTDSLGGFYEIYGLPRTYGVSAHYRF